MLSSCIEPITISGRSRVVRDALSSVTGLLLIAGIAFRAAPLLNQNGRLLRQFPTEDGYLMLTIARNLALGHGMSTAGGAIPTNGTQPGITFLWALCYRLVDGDKVLGLAVVQGVQILIELLAAYALYRLGTLLLAHRPDGPAVAALAAGLWYAAPLTVEHSQNCLETGAYAAAVLLALWACLAAWQASARWHAGRCLALGALLGGCFWVRNDAALLVLAVCLVRTISGLSEGRRLLGRRIFESVIVGLAALCVALPWMVHNVVKFGHLMPISGVAEALDAEFADNLRHVPPKLAEYVLVAGAIPRRFEQHPAVMGGSIAVVLAGVGMGYALWRQADPAVRATMGVAALFGVLLAGFYGLYFGAGYFMSRYLFPLSPLLALTTVAGLSATWSLRCGSRWRAAGAAGLLLAALVAVFALNARLYANGHTHIHFAAAEWVRQNVPDEAWVAAPQTGTLGYFHDRTLNLDGKVNPEALRARMQPGTPNGIPRYILDKQVEYLVDWAGLAAWANLPGLKPHFKLVVCDREANLAVLRRK